MRDTRNDACCCLSGLKKALACETPSSLLTFPLEHSHASVRSRQFPSARRELFSAVIGDVMGQDGCFSSVPAAGRVLLMVVCGRARPSLKLTSSNYGHGPHNPVLGASLADDGRARRSQARRSLHILPRLAALRGWGGATSVRARKSRPGGRCRRRAYPRETRRSAGFPYVFLRKDVRIRPPRQGHRLRFPHPDRPTPSCQEILFLATSMESALSPAPSSRRFSPAPSRKAPGEDRSQSSRRKHGPRVLVLYLERPTRCAAGWS